MRFCVCKTRRCSCRWSWMVARCCDSVGWARVQICGHFAINYQWCACCEEWICWFPEYWKNVYYCSHILTKPFVRKMWIIRIAPETSFIANAAARSRDKNNAVGVTICPLCHCNISNYGPFTLSAHVVVCFALIVHVVKVPTTQTPVSLCSKTASDAGFIPLRVNIWYRAEHTKRARIVSPLVSVSLTDSRPIAAHNCDAQTGVRLHSAVRAALFHVYATFLRVVSVRACADGAVQSTPLWWWCWCCGRSRAQHAHFQVLLTDAFLLMRLNLWPRVTASIASKRIDSNNLQQVAYGTRKCMIEETERSHRPYIGVCTLANQRTWPTLLDVSR